MRSLKKHILKSFQLKIITERIISLIKTPVFWLLTIGGNAFIIFGALLMQKFEASVNPAATHLIDCLAWAVGIVTTVGAGRIEPLTFEGKMLTILMMMGGAVFLWSYMALFISTLVGPELKVIESEVSELQKASRQEDELLSQIRELIEQANKKRG